MYNLLNIFRLLYFSTLFTLKNIYHLFKYQSNTIPFTCCIINKIIIKYYIINIVSYQRRHRLNSYFDKYRTIILPIQTFAY